MCHRISLDRAGFEPRPVVAFVPDIANTELARKFESLIERVTGKSRTMGCFHGRLKSGADPFQLYGASMARRDIRPTFCALYVLWRLFLSSFTPTQCIG